MKNIDEIIVGSYQWVADRLHEWTGRNCYYWAMWSAIAVCVCELYQYAVTVTEPGGLCIYMIVMYSFGAFSSYHSYVTYSNRSPDSAIVWPMVRSSIIMRFIRMITFGATLGFWARIFMGVTKTLPTRLNSHSSRHGCISKLATPKAGAEVGLRNS